MSQSDIARIEQDIKDAKVAIDLGNSLERLRSNREFKKVVLEGYFEKESVRLVLLKADPAMGHPETQGRIHKAIDAIGTLHDYFNAIAVSADSAERSIRANEKELEQLRKEEVGGDE
jgi:hypothetical protein